MTKTQTLLPDKNGYLKVETNRSGPFIFQIGLDIDSLILPFQRADEAYARFSSTPMIQNIVNELEKMTLVTSVHSTNTIEGGELNEDETATAINLSPEDTKTEAQRRVTNLRDAYATAEDFAQYFFETQLDTEQQEQAMIQGNLSIQITEQMLLDLHHQITDGLPHEDNIPGTYRNTPKHRRTQVSDLEHGGVYRPPKCLEDVKLLIHAYISWANSEPVLSLPPLLRAPLLHYYFELIHPFWDGNGRTGRVIEALTLQCAKYNYAPYAVSKYYLDNIDAYFSLFNRCRKLANDKDNKYPNTEFVKFHLKGILSTINRLHDRANGIISAILYSSQTNVLYSNKIINARQYTILNQLPSNSNYRVMSHLMTEPWYKSLYLDLTNRTRKRDLIKLVELELIKIVDGEKIELVYAMPEITLSTHPVTASH